MEVFKNSDVTVLYIPVEGGPELTEIDLMRQLLSFLYTEPLFPQTMEVARLGHQEPYRYGYKPIWGKADFGYTVAVKAGNTIRAYEQARRDASKEIIELLPKIVRWECFLEELGGCLVVFSHDNAKEQLQVSGATDADIELCIGLVRTYPGVPFVFNGNPLTDETVDRMREAGCRVAFPRDFVGAAFAKEGTYRMVPHIRKRD